MQGGFWKSELKLELSCGFDNYEVKRDRGVWEKKLAEARDNFKY